MITPGANKSLENQLEEYRNENEKLKKRIDKLEQKLNEIIENNNNTFNNFLQLKKEINEKNSIIEYLKKKCEKIPEIEKKINSILLNYDLLKKNQQISNTKTLCDNSITTKEKSDNKMNEKSSKIISNLRKEISQKSKIINKQILKLSCKFKDNHNKIHYYMKNIKKNRPIKLTIVVINNGDEYETWPNDTFIRCINDDSDIYFKSTKFTHNKLTESYSLNVCFEVDIYFKNYSKIEKKSYSIKYELISDSQGKIGNEIGKTDIIVS